MMKKKTGKLEQHAPGSSARTEGETPTGHTVADVALSGGEENNGALPPYEPVPVKAARAIAEQYGKSIVIIFAHDPVHGLLHTTTYGDTPQNRAWAAQGGEIGTKALGGLREASTEYEDYRLDRIAELSEALEAVSPSWRAAGCWCARGHDIDNFGHQPGCVKARAALAKARGEKTDAR